MIFRPWQTTEEQRLWNSCFEGDAAVAEELLNKGVYPNICAVSSTDKTKVRKLPAVLAACARGHVDVVKHLLDHPQTQVNINLYSDPCISEVPLLAAVRNGHCNIVELMINHETVDCNILNENGTSALHIAVAYKNEEMTAILLGQNKVNVNIRNFEGTSAFNIALESLQKSVVLLFLQREDLDINMKNEYGQSPWLRFFLNMNFAQEDLVDKLSDCLEIVQCLLEHDGESRAVDINAPDLAGYNALHYAVLLQCPELVKLLLQNQIQVNVANVQGETPLTLATSKKPKETIVKTRPLGTHHENQFLVQLENDDFTSKDSKSNVVRQYTSPKPVLVRLENNELAWKIKYETLEGNVSMLSQEDDQNVDLEDLLQLSKKDHKSLNRSSQLILQALLDAQAEPNLDVTYEENPRLLPLFEENPCLLPLFATLSNYSGQTLVEMCNLLHTGGVDCLAFDNKNRGALHYAASRAVPKEVFEILVAEGCDVNHADDEGNSVLFEAVAKCSVDTIVFLIDKGADINYKNPKMSNKTVLMNAVANTEILQHLISRGAYIDYTHCEKLKLFHILAQHGSVVLLQNVISQLQNMNLSDDNWKQLLQERNSDEESVLDCAIISKNIQMVHLILSFERKIKIEFYPWKTLAKFDEPAIAKELLAIDKYKSDLVKECNDFQYGQYGMVNPLLFACNFQSHGFLKLLLNDQNVKGSLQLSLDAVADCIKHGANSIILQKLISCCPALNLPTKDKLLQLYGSCLLRNQRNLHVWTDVKGQTLLHLICEYQVPDHLKFMIENKANFQETDNNGITPAMILQSKPSCLHWCRLNLQPSRIPEPKENIQKLSITELLRHVEFGPANLQEEFSTIVSAVEETVRNIGERVYERFPDWSKQFVSEPVPETQLTLKPAGSTYEGTKSGLLNEFDFFSIYSNGQYTIEEKVLLQDTVGVDKMFVVTNSRKSDPRVISENFGKFLNDVVFERYRLGKLHPNVYMYQQCQVHQRIPKICLKYRSNTTVDLDVMVDFVPTMIVSEAQKTKIEEKFGIKPGEYEGDIIVIPKESGHNHLRYRWQLSFADYEKCLMAKVPLTWKLAFVLIKALRSSRLYKPLIVNGGKLKTDDDIKSYYFKTCLMHVYDEKNKANEITEDVVQLPRPEEYRAYISRNQHEIKTFAQEIIQKLEHFLENTGGIPHFFNQTFDILFKDTIAGGSYNLDRIKNSPRKEKKERILKFCIYARECINNDEVTVSSVHLDELY